MLSHAVLCVINKWWMLETLNSLTHSLIRPFTVVGRLQEHVARSCQSLCQSTRHTKLSLIQPWYFAALWTETSWVMVTSSGIDDRAWTSTSLAEAASGSCSWLTAHVISCGQNHKQHPRLSTGLLLLVCVKAIFLHGPTLPYLTLPYGEDVLSPSSEASNGPNAHPRINHKVTKSPKSPWFIPTPGTIPS